MIKNGKPVVGFIGLGIMGAAMAANLQKAGYQLVVNDIRKEAAAPHLAAGAAWADTAQAVAEGSAVLLTCLPGLAQIESVTLGPQGALAGMRPGQALFEMSTSTPELIKRLHARFAENKAHFLDAPISGGALGAQRARLAIWVGGDEACYRQFEPVLRAMGDHPVHVGAIGAGIVTKLVHNCTSQATQAAIAEIFSMGVKAGAEPLALWEAIRTGLVGRRRTFDDLIAEFLPGSYDKVQAPLSVVYKDMKSATDLGRQLGVPLRFANLAFADIQEAMNRGWQDRDRRSVMLLPQERAGISIKVSPDAIAEVLRRDPPASTDVKHA